MKKKREVNRESGKRALKGLIKFIIIPLLLLKFLNWKWGVGFFIFVSIVKFIKIKRRKYFAKDLEGKEVETKQFLKRWKEGLSEISPLAQARTNLLGNWITLTGVLAGIIINALVRMSNQWIWIEIVLSGSLVLVVVQMIGGFQKYWRFKETDKIQKQIEEDLKKAKEGIFKEEVLKEVKGSGTKVLNDVEENPALEELEGIKEIKMEKFK